MEAQLCCHANVDVAAVQWPEGSVVNVDVVIIMREGELLQEGVALDHDFVPINEDPRLAEPVNPRTC